MGDDESIPETSTTPGEIIGNVGPLATEAYMIDVVVTCSPEDTTHPELDVMTINFIGFRESEGALSMQRDSPISWKHNRGFALGPDIGDVMFVAQTDDKNEMGIVVLSKQELADYIATAPLQNGEIKQEREFISYGTSPRLRATFTIVTKEKLFDTIPDSVKVDFVIDNLGLVIDDPVFLSICGQIFLERFRNTRNKSDIDSCVMAYVLAVHKADSDDPKYVDYIYLAAKAFLERFEQNQELSDINRGVCMLKGALSLLPTGHEKLVSVLIVLGDSYTNRFKLTGNQPDISFAISHLQRVIELTPDGHPDMSSRMEALAASYHSRWKHTDDLEDISSALSLQKRALRLDITPDAAPDMMIDHRLYIRLGNLAMLRGGLDGGEAWLNNIPADIVYAERALELTPSGDSSMPDQLDHLGLLLLLRFALTRDHDDISSAISYQGRALEYPSDGREKMSHRHGNLALSLMGRSTVSTKPLDDLSLAILHATEAVELTTDGSPSKNRWLYHLGISFTLYFEGTNKKESLLSAISAYQSATSLPGFPSTRLEIAMRWAALSNKINPYQSLVAYEAAIGLLTQVAGIEQTIQKRYTKLSSISNFTTAAASVAFSLEEGETALEWLEQGRCLVWNQLQQLRTPVDDLREHDSSLADRFLDVSRKLEKLGSRGATFPSQIVNISEMIAVEADGQEQFRLAQDWTGLIDEIRDIRGFQEFLQPRKVSTLLAGLPEEGPVVIFNIQQNRCDALALIAGVDIPLHIPLEDFSYDKAHTLHETLYKYLDKKGIRLRHADSDRAAKQVSVNEKDDASGIIANILRDLWMQVIKPVLDALAYSFVPSHPSQRTRIWWCPTGPLAFLPIHAAGIYGKEKISGSCVSDFVVSSYTPTISMLLNREESFTKGVTPRNLLLISQPNTPGLSEIPATREETRALKKMIDDKGIESLLLESAEAKISRVTEEMKAYSWVHFACHAKQDTGAVLKSGLHLHDGRLELSSMSQLNIPNAEHAFLSACQTSAGDENLSEEAVHLAAGMLAVGYRGVVATMWSIKDRYGPEVAKDFYGHLFESESGDMVGTGLEGGSAPYALDYATQRIREKLEEHGDDDTFLAWVPYVHFGI